MKKQLKNKLVLDRETVTVLQSDTLDNVNGGAACTTTGGLSSAISRAVSRFTQNVSYTTVA